MTCMHVPGTEASVVFSTWGPVTPVCNADTLFVCLLATLLCCRLLLPSTAGVHPFYSSFFVRWNLWTGPFCVATMAYTPYFGSQVCHCLQLHMLVHCPCSTTVQQYQRLLLSCTSACLFTCRLALNTTLQQL